MLSRQRLALWLLPLGIATGVGTAVNLPALLPAGSDPVPVLPQMTPAQVLELVHNSNVTSGSGDITMTARLGLPDLGSLGGPATSPGSVMGLLSGTHTAHVWVGDGEHVRVALDAPSAETDWIRNGSDLWAWDSSAQQVRHTTVQPDTPDGTGKPAHADKGGTIPPMDPATAADQVLAQVTPTTDVSVRTPGYVAGRPVYELVVKPRSDHSTVDSVQISVDATTGMPLALQVRAKGSPDPAYEVAYTSISFDQPPAATFAFTPPPGVTVTEVSSPADLLPVSTWNTRHRGGAGNGTPGTTPPPADGSTGPADGTSSAPAAVEPSARTVGEAWDSVMVVSGMPVNGQLRNLLNNAPAVTLDDGSQARLISTRLVNLLYLPDGRIVLGAVDVDALKAAAGS